MRGKKVEWQYHTFATLFFLMYVVSPTCYFTISCSPYYSLITPKVLDVINLSLRLTPDDTLFTIGRVSPFPPSMICCELKS